MLQINTLAYHSSVWWCFWLRLCPKTLPCSLLGWDAGPSNELWVTHEEFPLQVLLVLTQFSSFMPHSMLWVRAAVCRDLPCSLPRSTEGSCAHTQSKTRSRNAAHSGRINTESAVSFRTPFTSIPKGCCKWVCTAVSTYRKLSIVCVYIYIHICTHIHTLSLEIHC